MTLAGSWSQHLAMLLTMFFIMADPSDLTDDADYKTRIEWVYLNIYLTHSLCFAVKLLMKWDIGRNSKLLQTVDALLVIMQIYLVLICIESFRELQSKSISMGNIFDPNQYQDIETEEELDQALEEGKTLRI